MRYLRRIVWSFSFAFAGLSYLVRTQSNVWVHLIAASVVILLSTLLEVRGVELALLALTIGSVLVAEAFNTALEAIVDLASPSIHPLARVAKDAAAAAVLLAAFTAIVVGLIIFLPPLLARVGLFS